jgi:hypothetical protein
VPTTGWRLMIDNHEWNAIRDMIQQLLPAESVVFDRVTKRDTVDKLVWTKEYGNLALPLVSFQYGFAYYDTQLTANPTNTFPVRSHQVRREDLTNQNVNFKTRLIVPKVGDMVVILDRYGVKRHPVCIGVTESKNFWVGEE